MDLAVLWFLGLGVLLTVYAVLDGYDLGVGTLHLMWRTDEERRLSLNSIGPLWDGNEVWLVTFGGALFAGFPEAYATILSSLYLPFMFLLFFLIGRAVAIELRSKHPSRAWRAYWDFSFAAASTLTLFMFGLFAGNLLAGLLIHEDGILEGSLILLFAPMPLSVAFLTVVTASLHGACFLQLKLDGELAERARRRATLLWVLFVGLVVTVTYTTLAEAPHAIRHFAAFPVAWAVPVLGALATCDVLRCLITRRPREAFAATSITIVMLCVLFGIAMFPNLVYSPYGPGGTLDLWESSSSESTLETMSIIAVIGAPLVVVYTVIVHYVFRGRVKLGKFSY